MDEEKEKEVEETTIVCISDTHRKHRDFALRYKLSNLKGDILVHTGDISDPPFNYDDFGDFIRSLPHKFKVIVPGNHDYIEEVMKYHDPKKNVFVLVNQTVKIRGITFYGHPWTYTQDSSKFYGRYPNKIPKCDVILTHVPPKYILDLAWDPKNPRCKDFCKTCKKVHKNFMHWGSTSLRNEILRAKPKFSVFGHVHDDPGTITIGPTTFVNATSYCTDFQKPIIIKYVHEKRSSDEDEDEGEIEEEEKPYHSKFFGLMNGTQFLGNDGSMTSSCEVMWKLRKDGYLETNDPEKKSFLSMRQNVVKMYEVFNNSEQGTSTKWKFVDGGGGKIVIVSDMKCMEKNLVLDVDAYDKAKVIGWKYRGSKNQKWKVVFK